MYNEKVIEIFKNPKNVGKMTKPDGVGRVGNPTCGDIMEISIRVENDIITDVKFLTFGCAAAIVSTSVATELIKGKTIDEALKVKNVDVLKILGDLPPVKIHCSVLAEEAIAAAVEDYRNKQKKLAKKDKKLTKNDAKNIENDAKNDEKTAKNDSKSTEIDAKSTENEVKNDQINSIKTEKIKVENIAEVVKTEKQNLSEISEKPDKVEKQHKTEKDIINDTEKVDKVEKQEINKSKKFEKLNNSKNLFADDLSDLYDEEE